MASEPPVRTTPAVLGRPASESTPAVILARVSTAPMVVLRPPVTVTVTLVEACAIAAIAAESPSVVIVAVSVTLALPAVRPVTALTAFALLALPVVVIGPMETARPARTASVVTEPAFMTAFTGAMPLEAAPAT